MTHSNPLAIAVAAAIVITTPLVFAQSSGNETSMRDGHGAARHGSMMERGMGHGRMGGPAAMLTQQDAGSVADMQLVMNLVHNNTRIKRSVTHLADGIKTTTESDDPKVAQDIKAHVASMSGRLQDGREFNLFSTTLPVIFDNAKNIKSIVEMTDKGAIVTRTSTDAKVVAALQAHAKEVTELVQGGRAAFHRGMSARMAMGPQGPRSEMDAARPGNPLQSQQHTH